MTPFQVKAALNNAFYFLVVLGAERIPKGPLSEKQQSTVRKHLLRSNWPRGVAPLDVPLRFTLRAWSVMCIEGLHERFNAELTLRDDIAAHKLGLK